MKDWAHLLGINSQGWIFWAQMSSRNWSYLVNNREMHHAFDTWRCRLQRRRLLLVTVKNNIMKVFNFLAVSQVTDDAGKLIRTCCKNSVLHNWITLLLFFFLPLSWAMPSVPSSKETTVNSPVCPHAGKLHGFSNGENKVKNGVENLKTEEESQEAARNIQIKTKNSSPERKWIRPDLPSRCTWSLEASKSDSPHTQVSRSACQSDIHCFLHLSTVVYCLLLQIKKLCRKGVTLFV